MVRGSGVLAVALLVRSCAGDEGAPEVADSGVLSIDGAELSWIREGEGPPVYVLGSSIYYPKAYSSELREHFELVFLDGRHFVPEYDPGEDVLARLDISTFADDVEALRRELGHDVITVVGHSIHGQIALSYADRYPESTEALVLIGAVPFRFSEFAEEADQVWEELASQERRDLLEERLAGLEARLAAAPTSRAFAESYDQRAPLYWADPAYDASYLLEGLEDGPAFAVLTSNLPTAEGARARLERISAPTLLVLGKLDFAIPYLAWERLLQGVSGVDYVLLEEDSHNPQTESPDRFDPVLIEWMAEHLPR